MRFMITKSRQGQAVVEMALVLPIFLLVLIGIFDFGRAMHAWGTLNYQCVQTARAAARRTHPLIARNVFSSGTHPSNQEAQEIFWRYRSPMMAQSDYEIPDSFTGVGIATKTVVIRASYNLTLITPILGPLVGDSSKNGKLTIHAYAQEEKE